MGASLVGDDVWEYQSSEYQEAPSYPKLTLISGRSMNMFCQERKGGILVIKIPNRFKEGPQDSTTATDNRNGFHLN